MEILLQNYNIHISNDDKIVYEFKEYFKGSQILYESSNMKPKHNWKWWNSLGIDTKQSLSYMYGEKDDEELLSTIKT